MSLEYVFGLRTSSEAFTPVGSFANKKKYPDCDEKSPMIGALNEYFPYKEILLIK